MSVYVKQSSGISPVSCQLVSGIFSQADSTNHPMVHGYQLYKLGRLVVFSVCDYKKSSGRIDPARLIGNLPEGFRPISSIRLPITTTGGETDHSKNPGNAIIIDVDGSVKLTCNYDTGNYCSWNGCFISKY